MGSSNDIFSLNEPMKTQLVGGMGGMETVVQEEHRIGGTPDQSMLPASTFGSDSALMSPVSSNLPSLSQVINDPMKSQLGGGMNSMGTVVEEELRVGGVPDQNMLSPHIFGNQPNPLNMPSISTISGSLASFNKPSRCSLASFNKPSRCNMGPMNSQSSFGGMARKKREAPTRAHRLTIQKL
ncbi:unnamed protein product [Strongylus vulgaris]|uniref:Uncharacterized protein n=1 Tax=Strongylus vulgaris TaxID=40348 RepID=A0A3P7JU78_STRVU|nr:unnamed protein product [Strongylus vulgaris]